jgi:hypothetical protein
VVFCAGELLRKEEDMNRKQYGLLVLLALAAGLMGGMVSSQFFMGKPVFAEKKETHEKIVRAEGFVLVDSEGNPLASLNLDPFNRPTLSMEYKDGSYLLQVSPGLIMITDKDRRPRVRLSFNEEDYPSIKLFDRKAKLRVALGAASLIFFSQDERGIWSAP